MAAAMAIAAEMNSKAAPRPREEQSDGEPDPEQETEPEREDTLSVISSDASPRDSVFEFLAGAGALLPPLLLTMLTNEGRSRLGLTLCSTASRLGGLRTLHTATADPHARGTVREHSVNRLVSWRRWVAAVEHDDVAVAVLPLAGADAENAAVGRRQWRQR